MEGEARGCSAALGKGHGWNRRATVGTAGYTKGQAGHAGIWPLDQGCAREDAATREPCHLF